MEELPKIVVFSKYHVALPRRLRQTRTKSRIISPFSKIKKPYSRFAAVLKFLH